MKKTVKKKITRKRKLKKKVKSTSSGIIPVLFIVALLALFSETVRTVPAGASSEKSFKNSFEVPKLNSQLIENKIINNDKNTGKYNVIGLIKVLATIKAKLIKK